MEKPPLQSETEEEFRQKIDDVLKRVKNLTIDLLLKEELTLKRNEVELYLYQQGQNTKNIDKYDSCGLLDELIAFRDFLSLEFMYVENSETQELSIEIGRILESVEERHGLSFGQNDDLFYQQKLFDMKADLLRESLRNGIENTLNEKRVNVARMLAFKYLVNDRQIPSKLKLLLSQKDINEVNRLIEVQKNAISPEISEILLRKLREKHEADELEKKRMIEQGVDPKIAERKIESDRKMFYTWASDSADDLSYRQNQQMVYVEEIVSDHDDPRDFYNDLVDAKKVEKLIQINS